jgi:hypothetical protein
MTRTLVISSLVLLAAVSTCEAGPWVLGKGHIYANAKYNFLRTTTLATPDGQQVEIPEFTLRQITYYAAYGWNDRFDVIFDGAVVHDSSIEAFGSASGVGDTRFGLQMRMAEKNPWVFSVKGLVQAPTGDATKGLGVLPTGSGVWEGRLLFSVGRSLRAGTFYAYAEVGHQFRGEGLRDGLAYEAQWGVNLGERLVAAFSVRGIQPYDSEPGEVSAGSAAGLGDGTTYTSFGPTVIVRLTGGWSAQFELEGMTNTRNIAPGIVFRISLAYSR